MFARGSRVPQIVYASPLGVFLLPCIRHTVSSRRLSLFLVGARRSLIAGPQTRQFSVIVCTHLPWCRGCRDFVVVVVGVAALFPTANLADLPCPAPLACRGCNLIDEVLYDHYQRKFEDLVRALPPRKFRQAKTFLDGLPKSNVSRKEGAFDTFCGAISAVSPGSTRVRGTAARLRTSLNVQMRLRYCEQQRQRSFLSEGANAVSLFGACFATQLAFQGHFGSCFVLWSV